MSTSLQQKISNRQLEIWSNQGAVDTPKRTHEKIRDVLHCSLTVTLDTFLQGSYANSTNIYGESDVDIVAVHSDAVYNDFSQLTFQDRLAQEAGWLTASYGVYSFRNDIIDALRDEFGTAKVDPGTKAIKVTNAVGSYEADVLPCVEHRRYRYSYGTVTYDTGIAFKNTSTGQWVTNFPKQHRENGATKNSSNRTSGNYKPVVRIFKNLRCKLLTENLLSEGEAPSYFIECLLYNVPDRCYRKSSYQEIVESILSWLVQNYQSLESLLCQNEITPLFGTDNNCWDQTHALKFILASYKYCLGVE